MTIELNVEAKPKPTAGFDYKHLKVLQYVAEQQKLKGMDKANIIFNLGIAYASMETNAEKDAFMAGKDLDSALTWYMTPQGEKFWGNLHSKLEYDI
jgi:hypothetical protein